METSSAFQLFESIEDSSLVDNINIAPQRPVKCFDNLVKKFDFNLIISNPQGSSNVKLGVTLEICTRKQLPKEYKLACGLAKFYVQYAVYRSQKLSELSLWVLLGIFYRMLYVRGWDPSSHLQTIDKILSRKGRIPSGIVWGLSQDLNLDCFLGEVESNPGYFGGQVGSRLELYLALKASHLKIKAGSHPQTTICFQVVCG